MKTSLKTKGRKDEEKKKKKKKTEKGLKDKENSEEFLTFIPKS